MEIQNFTPNALNSRIDQQGYTAGVEQVQRERTSADSTTARPQGDTVNVSQDAVLMNQAARTAQNTPDVRTEQVEALRIQVANGTYKPDSRMIAENLVREEPGLFR